jgi:hypothetical protein
MSVFICYFRSALFNAYSCLQVMLSQDRHITFYGADPGSTSLVAQYNQGIILPEVMCSVSNPVDVLQGTIHDVSIVNQVIIVHLMTC